MAFRKVIIYDYPLSQNCTKCENGKFVILQGSTKSNYICNVNCERNDGVNCPMRKLKEEEK